MNDAHTRYTGGAIDFLDLNFPETTTKIWIYNASRLSFSVDHPLLHHVSIPGNGTRKSYCMYTSLPSVVMVPQQEFGDKGEINVTAFPMDGRRLAMDLICPDNLTLDIDAKVPFSTGLGRDLRDKGVFWSEHNPPKPAEVRKAVQRMEVRYLDLLEKAAIQWESLSYSSAGVVSFMAKEDCSLETAITQMKLYNSGDFITPEHHAAADYFKVVTPWHPVLNPKLAPSTSKVI
jgi:hypothetical protein